MKKYFNIFLHPLTLPMLWIVYLLSFFAGVIRYFYIQNPEASLAILGKLANVSWHLMPVFLAVFVADLAFNVWNYTQGQGAAKNKISQYFVGGSSVLTFFLANYLLGLELSNYSNFLYSTYGITKDSIYWLSNVSLMIMVVFAGLIYFSRKYMPKSRSLPADKIITSLGLGILVWYSLLSFSKASNYIWYAKFTYSWVFENYDKIDELKKVVPENGIVIIPPQNRNWPDISNAPIVRYFLFPRTIVSGSYLIDLERTRDIESAYFMTMQKNDLTWPVINNKEKIINFGESDLLYEELTGIYEEKGMEVFKITF